MLIDHNTMNTSTSTCSCILTCILLISVMNIPGYGQEPERGEKIRYLTSEETTDLELPFSEAVRVGNMLYLSGMVGNVPGKLELVSGGVRAEAKQALENIRRVLKRYGSSMEHVVKCTIMIDDIDMWGEFNEVYISFFKEPYPARSAFGADGLALGAALEIECMAAVPSESE